MTPTSGRSRVATAAFVVCAIVAALAIATFQSVPPEVLEAAPVYRDF